MNIPNFHDIPFTDKQGNITDQWRLILIQLFTQLQQNVGQEGLVVPSQPNANFSTIAPNYPNGTVLFNSDDNIPYIDINGTFQPITVGGVTAIFGTTDQIYASSSTGNVTLSTPQDINTSASPTFNDLTLTGLTASEVVATNGSKSLTSIPYGSTAVANTLVYRDSNSNTQANNFIPSIETNTASGTITLTNANSYYQVFSGGVGSCIVVLPDATTLSNGNTFNLNNSASGTITLQASGTGSPLLNLPSGGFVTIYLQDNSTIAGQWDWYFGMPSNANYGTAGMTVTGAITATTKLTSSTFQMTSGASAGYVLTSDSSGNASWDASSSAFANNDTFTYTTFGGV